MGSRLYSSPFRFCIQIIRINIIYTLPTIIIVITCIHHNSNKIMHRLERSEWRDLLSTLCKKKDWKEFLGCIFNLISRGSKKEPFWWRECLRSLEIIFGLNSFQTNMVSLPSNICNSCSNWQYTALTFLSNKSLLNIFRTALRIINRMSYISRCKILRQRIRIQTKCLNGWKLLRRIFPGLSLRYEFSTTMSSNVRSSLIFWGVLPYIDKMWAIFRASPCSVLSFYKN